MEWASATNASRNTSRAEDIVHLCREVFGKGNGFCKKISYQARHPVTGKPGASPDEIAPEKYEATRQELIATACAPFDKPALRQTLETLEQATE